MPDILILADVYQFYIPKNCLPSWATLSPFSIIDIALRLDHPSPCRLSNPPTATYRGGFIAHKFRHYIGFRTVHPPLRTKKCKCNYSYKCSIHFLQISIVFFHFICNMTVFTKRKWQALSHMKSLIWTKSFNSLLDCHSWLLNFFISDRYSPHRVYPQIRVIIGFVQLCGIYGRLCTLTWGFKY